MNEVHNIQGCKDFCSHTELSLSFEFQKILKRCQSKWVNNRTKGSLEKDKNFLYSDSSA